MEKKRIDFKIATGPWYTKFKFLNVFQFARNQKSNKFKDKLQ